MEVDVKRASKPFRALRKLLQDLHPDPSPEEVHNLRTEARKLEAILHALGAQAKLKQRRILKLIKPVRRSAGRVRDMDVLMTKAAEFSSLHSDHGLEKLLARLGQLRTEHAHDLYRTVKRRRKAGRRTLKLGMRRVQKLGKEQASGVSATPAAAQVLAAQLEQWPKLHKENLHEFRKSVKELRYMLRIFPESDHQLIEACGRVKDSAGEWHDWMELYLLSSRVLDTTEDAELLAGIRARLDEKLRDALTSANRLRKQGFELASAA